MAPSDDPDDPDDLDGRKIPVTLVTGFLGSGKTTFIRRLLKERHGMRIAVLQNEFSPEMGIEKPVLSAGGASVFELANGCLCCSLKDGIVEAVESILQFSCRFDWLVVEAAGNVDPLELMSNFWVDPESPLMLDGVLCVTCPAILGGILCESKSGTTEITPLYNAVLEGCTAASAKKPGNDQGTTAGGSGSRRYKLLGKDTVDCRDMRELMIKQLSVADVIIINKADQWETCFSDMKFRHGDGCPTTSAGKNGQGGDLLFPINFSAILKHLNPAAKVLSTKFCEVDLDVVMNLRMFDASRIMSFPREAHNGRHHHHHGNSTPSNVFVKSVGTYSLNYVNDFVSQLLWESGATVYRCKGIFRATNDCPMVSEANGEVSIFQLQGMGMLFEITPVDVAELDDNRFLFIGPKLDADHIINGLKLSQ